MSFKMEPTPEIIALTEKCKANTGINPELYKKYDVKKGLRDVNGNGVRAGLTRISTIIAKEEVNGESVPCAGRLYFRGIDVRELTKGFNSEGRFGFEETAYLILYGKLPTAEELEDFMEVLADSRSLPKNFVRDVIMKAPSKDMMNTLARSVLTLYAYDKNSDDTSLDNVMRQCLMLIAV
ncbi:MAG: citrate synthase, partial [Lachnospiraceae bacterium]|nr:citrate synthase [Lachnospiraceae bacterium]